MRYRALATDFDGTLATHGRVADSTKGAVERLRTSGRKLVMVTGRQIEDLRATFPEFHLFDVIVAENGALLYWPEDGRERTFGEGPPPEFLAEAGRRGVAPFSVGRVIFATWEPHEKTVLEIIHDLGLEFQIIFNKGAVMVLPAGVNKAVGLSAALRDLEISADQVVGVGDAENDHAFLETCGFSAAVANALPALKERCDLVTRSDHGAGVEELIAHLLAEDLASFGLRRPRRTLESTE